MTGSGTSAGECLVSLVSEERRGRPGAAIETAIQAAREDPQDAAAQLFVAVYAALAVGEPRQALHFIETIGEPANEMAQRRIRACSAWAQRLGRNWYPGDTGGEFGPSGTRGFTSVGEVFEGDAETMLLEACVAFGPANLLSVRSLLESMVRKSSAEAQVLLQSAMNDLERFKQIAQMANAPTSACWAVQCQADLLYRSGTASKAQKLLEFAREIYGAGEDGIGVACTYLVEGDWFATPGSSPEALSLDLAGRPEPSPFATTQDVARATEAYNHAESSLAGVDAPRVVAALALRRAVLCHLEGDLSAQLDWLQTADQMFMDAGETSGCHLVTVHRLVAAISAGDFVQLRRNTPLEWGATHGPVADILAWGLARGSLSFCTGLGRIFERTAERWEGQGDLDRAEVAYLMARPLLSLSGVIPSWSILLTLAGLDARRNAQVRSLVRRLKILADLPLPPKATEQPTAWMQDLQLTMSLIDIPTGSIGTGMIAIQAIERGMKRLGALLESAVPVDVNKMALPMDAEVISGELQEAWVRNNPFDSTRPEESELPKFTRIALDTATRAAIEQLKRAKPQGFLLRALQAERLGWDAEADIWYQAALEAVESTGDVNRWLAVVILGAWGKHEEAVADFTRIHQGHMVHPSLIPSLALRARDFETAHELFSQLDKQTVSSELSWMDLLDRAEAALECKETEAAQDLARRAIALFEDGINRLPRDSDRVASCDDVKAALLYLLLSRIYLAVANRRFEDGDEAAQLKVLDQGFAITDRGHALALPRLASADTLSGAHDEGRLKRWQQAATDQTTAYQRYLTALVLGGVEPIENRSEMLSNSEQRLADIEASLEPGERKWVLDLHRPKDFSLEEAQSRLPNGVCLLEYHLVGRDLVAWGVTRSSIQGWYKRISGRPLDGILHRFQASCSSGAPLVESDVLARLLVEPFAKLLDRNERIIVVPSGPLHAAPFHVLPFRGESLGVTHVISYLPSASLLKDNVIDRPLDDGEALVVGDPQFSAELHPSLSRLAGAALESQIIGRLYKTRDVFTAADAREATIRPLLHQRAVVHFAAHGRLDETAPNTSSIILAGDDQLTVSDLIGLRIDADLAVLSACDTGRGALSLGGDVVGLTRGLLAAGVKRSVVSLWPVDDVAACVTMVGFHEKLLGGDAPALALASAQREVRAMSGIDLAGRYQELGGELELNRVSVRRKSTESYRNTPAFRQLAAFPEADLDDEPDRTVGELNGSLPSIWAPFVLIGF